MNQRSNQPDGDLPPQKAKKKAKKSDDAPTEIPLAPTSDDPADYRLCAVELRACARDVRGWKSRQPDFLRRSLESILRHHDAAIGRIGFPPAVEMKSCDDGVWCSVVFITPTGGWSHWVPLGPRRRHTYEPQLAEIEPEEEAAVRASLDPSTIETLERLQAEWGTSDQPLSFLEVVAMCMLRDEWAALRRRREPKRPVLATPALDAARQRAIVPSVTSGLPAAPREAAIAQLAERLFAEEFEVVQLIAGALETLAECVEFLADFKPPEGVDAEAMYVLKMMIFDGATSANRGINVKERANLWKGGPLGTGTTRPTKASKAVERLKKADYVAPRGRSTTAYVTAMGQRIAGAAKSNPQ